MMGDYRWWIISLIPVILTNTVPCSAAQGSGALYITDITNNTVFRVNINDGIYTPLPFPSLKNPYGVAVDQNNYLYVTERGTPSVASKKRLIKYSLEENETLDPVELPRAYIPEGVAVDGLSGLVFYTEAHYKTINVVTTNLLYSTKVITKNLNKPRDVALHPLKGLLFWTDWGDQPHIGRAFMDGTDQTVIISRDIIAPTSVDVDIKENQLYWTDSELGKLSACDLEGASCREIYSGRDVMGLALDENFVYLTIKTSPLVHQILKTAGSENSTLLSIGTRPSGMSVNINSLTVRKDSLYYQGPNQCSEANGNCSQICLPGRTAPTCRCHEGFRLELNGSCTKLPFEKGLFYTDKYYHGIYRLDLEHDAIKRHPAVGINIPKGIDHDLGKIFWSDSRSHVIISACEDGTCAHRVGRSGSGFEPVGLELDKKNHLMYVIDAGRKVILRQTYGGSGERLLIITGLDKPYDITLDTVSRKMYWSESGAEAKIERANMEDGKDREDFITEGLVRPRGLTIDLTVHGGVLYWADGDLEILESVNIETRAREVIYRETGTSFSGLSLGRGILYASIEGQNSIFSIDVRTRRVQRFGFERVGDVHDLVYYDNQPPDGEYTPQDKAKMAGGPGSGQSNGDVNKTMVISLAVVFGSLLLITIVLVAGCLGYRKLSAKREKQAATNSLSNPTYCPEDAGSHGEPETYLDISDVSLESPGAITPTNPKLKPFGLLRPLPSLPKARQVELQHRQPPIQLTPLPETPQDPDNITDPFQRAMIHERQRQEELELHNSPPDLLNMKTVPHNK